MPLVDTYPEGLGANVRESNLDEVSSANLEKGVIFALEVRALMTGIRDRFIPFHSSETKRDWQFTSPRVQPLVMGAPTGPTASATPASTAPSATTAAPTGTPPPATPPDPTGTPPTASASAPTGTPTSTEKKHKNP